MTTLVKIRGLTRENAANTGGLVSRGFRVRAALGQKSDTGTAATKTIGTSNAAVTYTAKYGGAAFNNVQIAHVVAGNNTAASVVTTYATGTANPTITVNASTDGGGLSTLTATAAAALVNADAVASSYVTATAGGTGASVIVAGAAGALTGGADGTGSNSPFFVRVSGYSTVVVDIDDPQNTRSLARNPKGWISLGPA